MDRQLAKHHAAARLRRQIEEQVAARDRDYALQASYSRGRRTAQEEAIALSALPSGDVEEIKARLIDYLARELARAAYEQLPPNVMPAMLKVAEEFTKHFGWNVPHDSRPTLRAMMEHHMDRMEFRISLPPMNAAVSIDRRQIAMRRRA